MPKPTDQFNDRAIEIELYFDFLQKVVVQGATLRAPSTEPSPFDLDLQKVLKANAVILLYNLIESSIRNGLLYIHDTIIVERYAYKTLRKEIQLVWLNHWIRTDKPVSTAEVHGLIQKIMAEEVTSFDTERIRMHGNLDARKIKELSRKYGFSHVTPDSTQGGNLLFMVKQGRNDLAHGRKSFTEYGRDLTFPALEEMKVQVIIYLKHILENMERFVTNKEYVGSALCQQR